MRLLVISNMYPGPRKPHFGVFVARRVKAYEMSGVEVKLVALDDPRKGTFRTVLKYATLTVRSVVAALRLKPDAIEGHYLVPTGFITALAGRAARVPFVLYAHGSDVRVRMPGTAWAVRRAAEIHTNSADTAERIKARFPGVERVMVVPPGVDLDVFKPGERPAGPPTVVFVGDLLPHKGVDVLLSALALLEDVEWRCLVAGSGPQEAELVALANRLGIAERVTWLGAVSPGDVVTVFTRGDLAVVPSRQDAFGQVAVEALACGVPVVVSAVGGLASVPSRGCGEAVPPEQPSALGAAIQRWLMRRDDPSVRAAALARAAEFSLEEAAELALRRLQAVTES